MIIYIERNVETEKFLISIGYEFIINYPSNYLKINTNIKEFSPWAIVYPRNYRDTIWELSDVILYHRNKNIDLILKDVK